jgi:hypothetical protein
VVTLSGLAPLHGSCSEQSCTGKQTHRQLGQARKGMLLFVRGSLSNRNFKPFVPLLKDCFFTEGRRRREFSLSESTRGLISRYSAPASRAFFQFQSLRVYSHTSFNWFQRYVLTIFRIHSQQTIGRKHDYGTTQRKRKPHLHNVALLPRVHSLDRRRHERVCTRPLDSLHQGGEEQGVAAVVEHRLQKIAYASCS